MELYKNQYYNALGNIQGVAISAIPLYPLHNDHDYEMDILVQVTSGKLPSEYPRKDIDICIVLDRSGSMAQSMNECKNAIKHVIDSLHDTDTIHLIAYDDHVEKIFSDCNVKDHKDLMLKKIHSLHERGSTNLYNGVEAGLNCLLGSADLVELPDEINTKKETSSYLNKIINYFSSSESHQDIKENKKSKEHNESKKYDKLNIENSDKTKILFLFSDGMANAGITNSEKIGKMIDDKCENVEILISTFGIGNQYDEVLMSSIAYCGKGNYFYIQHPETIPQIIERGLNGLTRFWTENAKLMITPGNSVVVTDQTDLITLFKVREYALHRYLIKAKCSSKNAKITFTLNFNDYNGISKTEEVECSWKYEDVNINLVPNKQVKCYKIINECSELNKLIMNLMDDQSQNNEIKIKEIKNKIIELYTSVLEDDEYGIIGVLLKKEKDVLQDMNNLGAYSVSVSKKQGCSNLSTGITTKMCGYVSNSKNASSMCISGTKKTDNDLGYTIFI